jgi:membrane protease YdiL (CAAX protease family)
MLTSLVLVFPLFIIYQAGVLFTLPMLNGADFVTVLLLQTLGLSTAQYLACLAGAVAVFVVTAAVLRKKQRFDSRVVIPVLLESMIYALSMGSLIVLVMTKVLGIPPDLLMSGSLQAQGIVGRVVMSLGAGVYEEVVFRLLLLGGLVAAFSKFTNLGRAMTVLAAFILSSLAFSAMHHLPPHGDPLGLGVFTFRFLAGIFFALLFWFRGLAVAVYTHAFYDIYVLLIR